MFIITSTQLPTILNDSTIIYSLVYTDLFEILIIHYNITFYCDMYLAQLVN